MKALKKLFIPRNQNAGIDIGLVKPGDYENLPLALHRARCQILYLRDKIKRLEEDLKDAKALASLKS